MRYIKMTELIRCCLLFLVLRRVSSGVIADASKYGCIGGSTELYQSIPFNSPEVIISLYKNGEHSEMIAMWTMMKSVANETFKNGYSEKLFLDKYGNIWIRNLRISDKGKYTLQVIAPNWTSKHEVQLFVLVAPAKHCKPKIIRSENTLIASLEMNDCGKPSPRVYWLEHSGISYGKNVIKLQSGNEAGTYHACIEGPALKCAQSSKLSDFCEVFRVEENKIRSTLLRVTSVTSASTANVSLLGLTSSAVHFTLPETSGITTGTLAMITCIPLAILVGMLIIGSLILLRRMKKMEKKLTAQIIEGKERFINRQAGRQDDVYDILIDKNIDQHELYTKREVDARSPAKPYADDALNEVDNGLEKPVIQVDVHEQTEMQA